MSLPKFIGFTGTSQVGKDTMFSLLNEQFPDTFIRMAFADSLKRKMRKFLKTQFSVDILKPKNQEQKELVRPLLIKFGQCKRQVEPLYWVNKLVKECNRLKTKEIYSSIVITDFRFPNEAEYFKSVFGPNEFKLVEIVRECLTPTIPEEIENAPKMSLLADFKVIWPTVGPESLNELVPYAKNLYNQLNKEEITK